MTWILSWMPSIILLCYNNKKKETENKEFKIDYKPDYNTWKKQMEVYKDNKEKAHSFLWERYSLNMQVQIKSSTNYESTIQGNPIELLKVIKEYSLNYQTNKYDMDIVMDAINNFAILQQKKEENL